MKSHTNMNESNSPQCPIVPNHHVMIARKVDDVLVDALQLNLDKSKGKFINQEMVPPLTANYRQNRDIRMVSEVHKKLKKQIADCEKDDLQRKQLLKETFQKCKALKDVFTESEMAHTQIQKQNESHQQLVRDIAKEGEVHKKVLKRYLKVGEKLKSIWEIMQTVIDENMCYKDFVEQLSTESSGNPVQSVTERYENLVAVNRMLSGRLNQQLDGEQQSKNDLIRANTEFEKDLNFEFGKLQAVNYEFNSSMARNAKFEMALNNMSLVTVEQMTHINQVLKSAEQIMEKMIANKAIDKSYRKKSLAQLFEAIRADYVKKKMVIHRYARAEEKLEKTKSRRLKMYEKFENRHVVSEIHQVRLKDLAKKKKMVNFKGEYESHLKKLKRMGQREEEDLAYNVTDDQGAVLRLGGHRTFSYIPNEDDFDDEKDDGSLELFNYSSEDENESMQNDLGSGSSFITASSPDRTQGSNPLSVTSSSSIRSSMPRMSIKSLSPGLTRRRGTGLGFD